MTIELLSIACKSQVCIAAEQSKQSISDRELVGSIPVVLRCTQETCDFGDCRSISIWTYSKALQQLTQLTSVIEDMRILVEKYPEGYEGWEKQCTTRPVE